MNEITNSKSQAPNHKQIPSTNFQIINKLQTSNYKS